MGAKEEEERGSGREPRAEPGAGLAGEAGELLDDVAAEARADVERVVDEGRERHQGEGDAEGRRHTEDLEKAPHAEGVDEVRRLGRLRVTGREHHHAAEADCRHERLEEHRAVADRPGVELVLELLARRTGGDQRMEAGARAAGDRDEEHRHEAAALGRPGRERRIADLRIPGDELVGKDQADRGTEQRHIQKAAAEMATRLEEEPHGRQRRHETVGEQQNAPDLLGTGVVRADDRGEVEGDPLAGPDREADQRHEDRRRQPDRHLQKAHAHAHHEREDEIEEARRRDPAAGDSFAILEHLSADEARGGDVGEGDDDVDQRDPHERQKEDVAPPAHVVADHLGDRAGLVADARHERREVVNAADEDAPEEDPGERRGPAEGHPGEDRADDRTGGGDRREVLAEEEARADRLVVDVVAEGDRRSDGIAIEPEESGEDRAVNPVGQEEHRGDREEDGKEAHGEWHPGKNGRERRESPRAVPRSSAAATIMPSGRGGVDSARPAIRQGEPPRHECQRHPPREDRDHRERPGRMVGRHLRRPRPARAPRLRRGDQ